MWHFYRATSAIDGIRMKRMAQQTNTKITENKELIRIEKLPTIRQWIKHTSSQMRFHRNDKRRSENKTKLNRNRVETEMIPKWLKVNKNHISRQIVFENDWRTLGFVARCEGKNSLFFSSAEITRGLFRNNLTEHDIKRTVRVVCHTIVLFLFHSDAINFLKRFALWHPYILISVDFEIGWNRWLRRRRQHLKYLTST